MLKTKNIDALFDALSVAQNNLDCELQKQGLLSDLPDDWFIQNVIKSVMPTELVRVLAKVDSRFESRDKILKSVLRIWLIVGNERNERNDYVKGALSSWSLLTFSRPKKREASKNRKLGTRFGQTQSQLAKAGPEVARMSFLAGSTQRRSIRSRKAIEKGMQKRRNEIDYTIILLRSLHCFIVDAGEDNLDFVAKEAILNAVYGLKAREDGAIEDEKALKETKKLHVRPSRDTLFKAWKRYADQAIILYAISSIEDSEGQNLLDKVMDPKSGQDVLYEHLGEILSRAYFINESILPLLSDAEGWHTKVKVGTFVSEKKASSKINAQAINLIREVGVKPMAFAPKPVAIDILLTLRKIYKI